MHRGRNAYKEGMGGVGRETLRMPAATFFSVLICTFSVAFTSTPPSPTQLDSSSHIHILALLPHPQPLFTFLCRFNDACKCVCCFSCACARAPVLQLLSCFHASHVHTVRKHVCLCARSVSLCCLSVFSPPLLSPTLLEGKRHTRRERDGRRGTTATGFSATPTPLPVAHPLGMRRRRIWAPFG